MTNIDYNELLIFDSLEESQQHVADDLQPPVIHHCYQLSRLPFRTESNRLRFGVKTSVVYLKNMKILKYDQQNICIKCHKKFHT